jgi:hypothetical protein
MMKTFCEHGVKCVITYGLGFLLVSVLFTFSPLLFVAHAQDEATQPTPRSDSDAAVFDLADEPLLQLDDVGSTVLTSETGFLVSGRVLPGASLSVNDVPIAVAADGSFTTTFDLAEGVYQLVFDVRVPSVLLRRTVTVRVDTSPPQLRVNTPATLLSVPTVRLSGTLELDSRLVISRAGETLRELAAASESAFNIEVELVEGVNVLDVAAIDQADNRVSRRFAVVFDTTAPLLELLPLPASTRNNALSLRGVSEPATNVRVTSRQGIINAEMYPDGSFSARVPLLEGSNDIVVRAVDSTGNVSEQTFNVVQDTLAPQIVVTSPAGNLATQANTLTLSGQISDSDPGSVQATLNGAALTLTSGAFDEVVTLEEGLNGVVIVATDAAGNTSERQVTIVRDTTAPELVLLEPVTTSNTATSRLLARTDDSANATLNGVPISVLPGGIIATDVSLEVGENRFVLAAVDALGNRSEVITTITYNP